MSAHVEICFRLDGQDRAVAAAPNTALLDLLRERYGLTGVKASCERGVCGACTVLVDGTPSASCSLFAFAVDGSDVETVHGQAQVNGQGETVLGPVQRAFAERAGFQCGYCTPGMIMLATALLREHPDPDESQIRSWISSNICRCTGYQMIIESVRRAAELLEEEAHD
ncbi:(2Fe-2S)-binding protein [Streptomyces sp. NPDC056161]|uniref:(2Fe-2S)-binding protein n=1 Tax=Streptomyces sp. NPDC056161 TaxID=3345732 RepID=UPI0035D54093